MAAIAQAAPGARSEPPFPDNRSWEVDRVVLAQASERRAWLLELRDLVHLILDLRRRRPRAGIPGRFGLIRTEMTMRWNSIALAAASALLALLADTRAAAGDPAARAGEGLTFSSASVRIARIQVKAGVSFDDAAESMRLRANQRNLKYISVNQLGKEIAALSGKPWRLSRSSASVMRWRRRK
jgi:hypothetical protein